MRSSEWPVWHCQLEATAATVAGCLTMWRAIPATGSRPRLSATPSRFTLSFRDVEDLLAQRGITVSYESIRHWCETFGVAYARRLRRRSGPVGDTWHLDELFVTIRGRRQYLWRAVDQDGEVIDILLQPRRDRHAAARFFRKLLKRS